MSAFSAASAVEHSNLDSRKIMPRKPHTHHPRIRDNEGRGRLTSPASLEIIRRLVFSSSAALHRGFVFFFGRSTKNKYKTNFFWNNFWLCDGFAAVGREPVYIRCPSIELFLGRGSQGTNQGVESSFQNILLGTEYLEYGIKYFLINLRLGKFQLGFSFKFVTTISDAHTKLNTDAVCLSFCRRISFTHDLSSSPSQRMTAFYWFYESPCNGASKYAINGAYFILFHYITRHLDGSRALSGLKLRSVIKFSRVQK